MITASLALILGVQSVGEVLVAVPNDDPETWSVEYPRLIQPYVADYRGCLSFANRYITGVPDFEAQHRSDLPRCEDVRITAINDSKEALVDAKTTLTDAELERLFTSIGKIHIQRGRDLDQQFTMRLAAADRAANAEPPPRPEPLVIELPDPSVVQTREDPFATPETPSASK